MGYNINDLVSQQDMEAISQSLIDLASQYTSNPEETAERIDQEKLILQPDETPPPPKEPPVQDTTLDDAQKEIERLKKELEGYKKRKPITLKDVERFLNPKNLHEERKKVVESKKTAWAEQEFPDRPGVVNINGKELNYKLARRAVDWGRDLSDNSEAFAENLALLRGRVTRDVYHQFGGWTNIKDITIVGSQLIINGVMYVPVIQKEYHKRLPLDTRDYLLNGCLAPLFDFSNLSHMKSLGSFYCDDLDFYVQNIADDIGRSRRIGCSTLFYICPKLQRVTIGTDTVTREELNKPESLTLKERIRERKRVVNLLDGYKLDVYAGTNGLQGFMFSSLKNYASHRGNKGLLKFCGGTLALTGLTAVAGVVNFGAHFVGGMFKTAKAAIGLALGSDEG